MRTTLLIIALFMFWGCGTRVYSEKTIDEIYREIPIRGLYKLENGIKKENQCEWDVWYDLSGMWTSIGKLKISKNGNDITINGPNSNVENEYKKIIENKSLKLILNE